MSDPWEELVDAPSGRLWSREEFEEPSEGISGPHGISENPSEEVSRPRAPARIDDSEGESRPLSPAEEVMRGARAPASRPRARRPQPRPPTEYEVAVGDAAGASAEIVAQNPEQPATDVQAATDTPRGVPLPSRRNNVEWGHASEARIQALTDMFGVDALLLGHLVFKVPPLAIRIRKGNITFRWKPLRTKESIAVKSGNAECYIEVDLAFVGLRQISNSLGDLITLYKKFPFVPIENVHIRRMMVPHAPNDTMAVCLETLIMDAVSGKPDQVMATLMLRWFNYKPYSNNFLFRREWRSLNAPSPRVQATGEIVGGQVEPLGSEEFGGVSAGGNITTNVAPEPPGSIVDLSAINEPTALQQSLPPEARIAAISSTDPSDPYIAPTYPVVYPFNSVPFMERVNSGVDSSARITTWNDFLTMKWKSFTRIPVPVSWQYEITRPPAGEEPIAPRPGATDPVTGDRDVILWMGDSIMTGFTGTYGPHPETHAGTGSVPLFEWDDDWESRVRDRHIPDFECWALNKAGRTSGQILEAWRNNRGSSHFGNAGDRLAAVVIHVGTNDALNAGGSPGFIETLRGNLRAMISEISDAGAITIILPLAPAGDRPPIQGDTPNNVQAHWDAANRAMMDVVSQERNAGKNVCFINYWEVLVDWNSYANDWNAPYLAEYGPGNPINIHPTGAAYRVGVAHIIRNLPIASMRGQQTANLWHVTRVQDGDSCFIEKDGEEREVRFKHHDTPETYMHHKTEGGPGPSLVPGTYTKLQLDTWLPHGQDSYRPSDQQWGARAKAALEGMILERDVTVDFFGPDEYDRHLAVMHVGQDDVSERMIREGFAYAMNVTSNDSVYLQAQNTASGAPTSSVDSGSTPIGIWSDGVRTVTLVNPPADLPDEIRQTLERVQNPYDWRRYYPPNSRGGFEPESTP